MQVLALTLRERERRINTELQAAAEAVDAADAKLKRLMGAWNDLQSQLERHSRQVSYVHLNGRTEGWMDGQRTDE